MEKSDVIDKTDKEFLIRKIVRWTMYTESAISEAGGVPDPIIKKFPVELLEILARNDLQLMYIPVDNPT